MKKIIFFNLDNDLDLVLAHRRSMQLAGLCGLNLVAQTSFATAVSEIARLVIEGGRRSELSLGLEKAAANRIVLRAEISSSFFGETNAENENFRYARKLVSHFEASDTLVSLDFDVPKTLKLTPAFIEKCKESFANARSISPYEEVKRKNVELQQLAESLLESENRYQELTNSLPLMMFSLASSSQILYANDWFLKFTGQQLDQLIGTNWFDWIKANQLDVDVAYLQKMFKARESFQVEILLAFESGTMWHLLSLTPQFDPAGELVQWFGFIVDIHAQKVVVQTLKDNQELIRIKEMMEVHQKQLGHTIEELNRSNQELARYAYVASHDLQEPIRKIRLLSDMLIEKYHNAIPEDGLDLVARLRKSAERMQMVIKDLLSYSRLNNDSISLKETVDLLKLVDLACENLEFMIQTKGATITVDNSRQLSGNAVQLLLLFQNLISNSVKFTAKNVKPSVVITSHVLSDQQASELKLNASQPWACIEIKDNGIGFEQRYSDQIFEVFQRLHSHNEFEGTGIGLSICKKIVEIHGGFIRVQSNVGMGSKFTLYLPLSVN